MKKLLNSAPLRIRKLLFLCSSFRLSRISTPNTAELMLRRRRRKNQSCSGATTPPSARHSLAVFPSSSEEQSPSPVSVPARSGKSSRKDPQPPLSLFDLPLPLDGPPSHGNPVLALKAHLDALAKPTAPPTAGHANPQHTGANPMRQMHAETPPARFRLRGGGSRKSAIVEAQKGRPLSQIVCLDSALLLNNSPSQVVLFADPETAFGRGDAAAAEKRLDASDSQEDVQSPMSAPPIGDRTTGTPSNNITSTNSSSMSSGGAFNLDFEELATTSKAPEPPVR